MLVPDKIEGELVYLSHPENIAFERPYGWAWAMALSVEAACGDARWRAALEPLGRELAARFGDYLDRLHDPVRSGMHGNSAFAMLFALHWCRRFDARGSLERRILAAAEIFYGDDRDASAPKPGPYDFLSDTLVEAVLMRAVLCEADFRNWFRNYLPRLADGKPETLVTPLAVPDRTDGMIVHLDGLNLSRAWCWHRLAAFAGPQAENWAYLHIRKSLPHIDDHYAGSHWLATFAMMALDREENCP